MNGEYINWTAKDTDGDTINSDPTENSWHQRTVDLTAYAGKTVNHFYIVADSGTPVGNWNIFYGDISIVHADGTVTTIYNRATSESFTYFSGGEETGTAAIVERSNQTGDSVTPAGTTTYFLADQIHSTRMTLAYGGWPMTQDTYYPFGVEPTPSASPDQYKFSGKERDPASGLDNFGARYYSAVMGRFMTPDWSASPEPVPYAKLDNPQSLNLYTYVGDNPVTGIDADGHKFCGSALGVLTTSYGQQVDATVSCAGQSSELFVGTKKHQKIIEQLKFRTIERSKNSWAIRWGLTHRSAKGGWIVQHMTIQIPGHGKYKASTLDYWEAWRVPKGSRLATTLEVYGYDDRFFSLTPGTTFHGRSRFYDGLTLPSSFTPYNRSTAAGALRSTSMDPNLPTSDATAVNERWWESQ